MSSRQLDFRDAMPRDKLLRGALAALALSQLLAFYMLCSHQVRKAEARRTAAQVERMAQSDCLQYLSNSTIASCSGQRATVGDLQSGGPVPVNYAVR